MATVPVSVLLRQSRVLTISNLKGRYRKTWAGFLWVVLNPLILFGTQCLVFKLFLKVEVPNYALFLVSGLLPWLFFTQSLDMCMPILQWSGRLFKSMPIHPMVYLLAQVLDNFINFLAAFLLILLPVWIVGMTEFHWQALALLPLAVFSLVMGVSGIAWIASILQVFFRDTRYVVNFGVHMLFFLTPIFYPVSFVPEGLRWLVDLNVLYQLISPFRFLIHDFDLRLALGALGRSFAVGAVFFGGAILLWRKVRNALYFAL